MKIVHIEDFFHPDAGYQINILPKYMVNQGHKVYVITSKINKAPESLTDFFGKDDISLKDQEYTADTGVEIKRVDTKGFISGRAVFEKELFKVVSDLNPDVIYVHGNDSLTAMRYLLRYKKKKFPLVLDSHMLEMASVNKFNKVFRFFYRSFFSPIIVKNEIPVIRTQNDNYVEKHLGIPLSQSPWISVGSDTLIFKEDQQMRRSFRKELNIGDEDFVIVYTGKLDEAKGAKLLANVFVNKFNEKNVVLLVVGNSNGHYGSEVEKIFEKSENRILRFPTQKYKDLAKFYQSSDLSIFPKQCSLSFYDAQACGLPVVSENNSINTDRLKFNNGFTFEKENLHDFRQKIIDCISMPVNEYQKMRNNAIEMVRNRYDYSDKSIEYMQEIKKVYTNED
ncbi:glycosyltransferase family 4 protein [Planococcus sp. 11815]|uniref:glycosyltransferase family 4 protein n=1 Tax=Planococcus sp. 11815 TaxID=2939413 RepID=UPI003DA6187D